MHYRVGMALHSGKNKSDRNMFLGSKRTTRTVKRQMSRRILGWLLTVRGCCYTSESKQLTKLTYRFRLDASPASPFIYSLDWSIHPSFYQPTTIFVSASTFNICTDTLSFATATTITTIGLDLLFNILSCRSNAPVPYNTIRQYVNSFSCCTQHFLVFFSFAFVYHTTHH